MHSQIFITCSQQLQISFRFKDAHPAVSNNFLVATSHNIAIMHNDNSPLERFHVAEAFKVLLQPQNNFTKKWSKGAKRRFRSIVLELVLCTDLGLGMGMIKEFKANKEIIRETCERAMQRHGRAQLRDSDGIRSLTQGRGSNISSEDAVDKGEEGDDAFAKRASSFSGRNHPKFEERLLLMKVAIRSADISHPCKTTLVHKKWTDAINAEFFAQGRREKELGMPVSPLCEEEGFDLAKSQQGFISFLVRPTIEPLAQFADGSEWLDQLDANLAYWKSTQESNELENFENKLLED